MNSREIRLDASGLLRLKLEKLADSDFEPFWISGSDPLTDIPALSELSHLSIPLQGRILRLTEVIFSDNPLGGAWCARGFVAAASQGSVGFANGLLDAWLAGRWSVTQEARARAVIRSFSKRLRNGLLAERVAKRGVLNLSDLPAGIVPYIVRQRNCLRKRREWVVISGGDRLSPGFWKWYFDEDGIGEVIERQTPTCNLIESFDEIGIHLNHPRVASSNGHLHPAR
ncbi:MAG: hypothetical protein QF885_07655 [Candidatus Thalassarchaeaceae archaeon]|nr:hypothetical protein [Candidatus Thalassarchaeaceae archaeon]